MIFLPCRGKKLGAKIIKIPIMGNKFEVKMLKKMILVEIM